MSHEPLDRESGRNVVKQRIERNSELQEAQHEQLKTRLFQNSMNTIQSFVLNYVGKSERNKDAVKKFYSV